MVIGFCVGMPSVGSTFVDRVVWTNHIFCADNEEEKEPSKVENAPSKI